MQLLSVHFIAVKQQPFTSGLNEVYTNSQSLASRYNCSFIKVQIIETKLEHICHTHNPWPQGILAVTFRVQIIELNFNTYVMPTHIPTGAKERC